MAGPLPPSFLVLPQPDGLSAQFVRDPRAPWVPGSPQSHPDFGRTPALLSASVRLLIPTVCHGGLSRGWVIVPLYR